MTPQIYNRSQENLEYKINLKILIIASDLLEEVTTFNE